MPRWLDTVVDIHSFCVNFVCKLCLWGDLFHLHEGRNTESPEAIYFRDRTKWKQDQYSHASAEKYKVKQHPSNSIFGDHRSLVTPRQSFQNVGTVDSFGFLFISGSNPREDL